MNEILEEKTKTLNVPISLHKALKVKVANEGGTIKELLVKILKEALRDGD